MQRTDLSDLAAFVAVAKHRSFRRAAVELRVSPSALSHAIRGVEERLGIRLLNRTDPQRRPPKPANVSSPACVPRCSISPTPLRT